MTHLSVDELKAWFEQGRAEDRERVIEHLGSCADCRRALSALAAAAEPPPASAPAITAAEAVPRGYAAHKAPGRGWAGWLRPAYGLAGAAMIVLAVIWLTGPPTGDPDNAIRSTELMALGPAGAADAGEFRWESPFDAVRYRVTVRDAKGVLIFTGEAAASPLGAGAPLRDRLTAGESYTWQVVALDAAGDPIAESRPMTFRYQP